MVQLALGLTVPVCRHAAGVEDCYVYNLTASRMALVARVIVRVSQKLCMLCSDLHAGTRLVVSASNSVHYVYSLTAPGAAPVARLTGHVTGSFYIRTAFSPEGDHVLSGSSNGAACIWPVCLCDRTRRPRILMNRL